MKVKRALVINLIKAFGTEINTPANETNWNLSFGFTQENGNETIINITLYPNGSIDFTQTSMEDYNNVTKFIQPITMYVESLNPSFDIWKILNGLFVGYYWFILSDLGQRAPIAYPNSEPYPNTEYLLTLNFSQPISFNNTNNVMLNTKSFVAVYDSIYSDASNETKLVIERLANPSNQRDPTSDGSPGFREIYLCTQRQIKSFISLIVSCLGLWFSLIGMFYAWLLFVFKYMDMTTDSNGTGNISSPN